MIARGSIDVLAAAFLAVAAAGGVAATPSPAAATWAQWLHVPGVFDLGGPRSDGVLVAAAHSRLLLISASGAVSAFAPGYSAPDGSESYIARSPGLAVDGEGCAFPRDDVLALDLRTTPPGVTRITAAGAVSQLATVAGVSTLSGITLDTVGDFGHRALVLGPAGQGRTQVSAIDCAGHVTTIGTVATALEGGLAVSPPGFGPFGGQLIAANEGDGSIYAVSPSGQLRVVAASGVPAGGDIGVESVGFVPVGGAAAAYYADRGTPGNPHPGTDSVLRLEGAALLRAGARPGDLLAATEGGATVVDVRCGQACTSSVVAQGPPTAHGEGRLLLVQAARATPGGVTAPGAGVASTAGGDGRSAEVIALTVIVTALAGAATTALFVRSRRRRIRG